MSLMVLGALSLGIYKHGDETAAIRNSKLQCACSSPLIMTRRVVTKPTQHGRYGTIEASRHEERHSVLDVRMALYIGNDCIADDSYRQSAKHDDAADTETVGYESDNNCHHVSFQSLIFTAAYDTYLLGRRLRHMESRTRAALRWQCILGLR